MHAALNLFMRTYNNIWLESENAGQEVIIDHLTMTFEENEMKKSEPEEEAAEADPVTQLVHMFSQSVMEKSDELPEDELYMMYCDIMAKSCGGGEEEGGEEEEGEGPSLAEQEIENMKLEFNQGRLAERGVAEMVLNNININPGIPHFKGVFSNWIGFII